MLDPDGHAISKGIKILALSDEILSFIYSPQVKYLFNEVDLIVGCGDLPYFYLEYVLNALDRPLFFVRGNHDKVVEYSSEEQRVSPGGATNLHGNIILFKGIIFAGVEGSIRYRPGPFMYTQAEMWQHVLRLVPRLLYNRMVYGRYLDVFVTHAPPTGTHDMDDHAHQGINAFSWFIKLFKPAYHLHGHIHVYKPDTVTVSQLGRTRVMNVFGYRELNIKEISPQHNVHRTRLIDHDEDM